MLSKTIQGAGGQGGVPLLIPDGYATIASGATSYTYDANFFNVAGNVYYGTYDGTNNIVLNLTNDTTVLSSSTGRAKAVLVNPSTSAIEIVTGNTGYSNPYSSTGRAYLYSSSGSLIQTIDNPQPVGTSQIDDRFGSTVIYNQSTNKVHITLTGNTPNLGGTAHEYNYTGSGLTLTANTFTGNVSGSYTSEVFTLSRAQGTLPNYLFSRYATGVNKPLLVSGTSYTTQYLSPIDASATGFNSYSGSVDGGCVSDNYVCIIETDSTSTNYIRIFNSNTGSYIKSILLPSRPDRIATSGDYVAVGDYAAPNYCYIYRISTGELAFNLADVYALNNFRSVYKVWLDTVSSTHRLFYWSSNFDSRIYKFIIPQV